MAKEVAEVSTETTTETKPMYSWTASEKTPKRNMELKL